MFIVTSFFTDLIIPKWVVVLYTETSLSPNFKSTVDRFGGIFTRMVLLSGCITCFHGLHMNQLHSTSIEDLKQSWLQEQYHQQRSDIQYRLFQYLFLIRSNVLEGHLCMFCIILQTDCHLDGLRQPHHVVFTFDVKVVYQESKTFHIFRQIQLKKKTVYILKSGDRRVERFLRVQKSYK